MAMKNLNHTNHLNNHTDTNHLISKLQHTNRLQPINQLQPTSQLHLTVLQLTPNIKLHHQLTTLNTIITIQNKPTASQCTQLQSHTHRHQATSHRLTQHQSQATQLQHMVDNLRNTRHKKMNVDKVVAP